MTAQDIFLNNHVTCELMYSTLSLGLGQWARYNAIQVDLFLFLLLFLLLLLLLYVV